MRLRCNHGFFTIQETKSGQVSDFMNRFGLSIVPWGDNYTFESIQDVPSYSIKGKTILGQVATTNFEGKPWELFEANGLVYDFNRDLVVPINSITQITEVNLAGNRFVSSGLILPGSLTVDGDRVRDYSAWFSRDTLRFLYTEVTYV